MYVLRFVQTKESTNTSNNRCAMFLDNVGNIIIMHINSKNNLPINIGDHSFIVQILFNE